MIARKCDRCGALHEYYRGDGIAKGVQVNGVTLIETGPMNSAVNRKQYDLCKNCMKELIDFMSKKGEEQCQKEYASGSTNT